MPSGPIIQGRRQAEVLFWNIGRLFESRWLLSQLFVDLQIPFFKVKRKNFSGRKVRSEKNGAPPVPAP